MKYPWICAGCGLLKLVYKRRQLTQYSDEASNWAIQCKDCHEAADEYWEERWAEYHAGLL